MERYLDQVEALGYTFCSLIAEAFGLGPDGLSQFFDAPELMQHRAKIVQYPVVEGTSDQGVGPHYDAGFLTFVSLSCVTGMGSFYFYLCVMGACVIVVVAGVSAPRSAGTKSRRRLDRRTAYAWHICRKYW